MNETQNDTEAIQGLWKVDRITSKGQTVGYSATHWEFDGNRIKEIVPYYVDGGPWGTFVLDATTTPKHIDTTYEYQTKGGESKTRTYKQAYELNGDTLRIGGAQIFGTYPEVIDDAYSTVTTLSKYSGPRPETKRASGIAPVESDILGTLQWSDDRDSWEASVSFLPDHPVSVLLNPLETSQAQTIANGESLVTWAKTHEPEVRAYAAAQLTDLAEEWREEDEEPDPITPETFAARITLGGITAEANGEATFWYNDNEIFAGHVIVVTLNAERDFTDAQIMG